MDERIIRFISALRTAGVRVSLAESADAFNAVEMLGIKDREAFRMSLVEKAKDLGFNSLLLTTYLQGEACQVGKVIAAITRQILIHDQPLSKPACLVAAGETTVTLNQDPSKKTGLGGRNQELALSCIIELAGCFNFAIISLATDGSDGPTNAAGAVITDKHLVESKTIQSRSDRIFKLPRYLSLL